MLALVVKVQSKGDPHGMDVKWSAIDSLNETFIHTLNEIFILL